MPLKFSMFMLHLVQVALVLLALVLLALVPLALVLQVLELANVRDTVLVVPWHSLQR